MKGYASIDRFESSNTVENAAMVRPISRLIWISLVEVSLLIACSQVSPGQAINFDPDWSRDEILNQTLFPYAGERSPGVSSASLQGKVMCGYQGWFTCPGDGADRGWHHWGTRRGFRPGSCSIDLWPDVSELDEDERFETEFRHADGSAAEVYSPLIAKTIDRHFRWMMEYGIDGVFVQRFGAEVRGTHGLYHFNRVLANCRAAANRHGRVWAVMYDLSGLQAGETEIVKEDWKQLVDRMRLTRDTADQAYLHHAGKPLVAVWGIGFDDNRRYSLAECAALVEFLQHDPEYGGNSVMIGVPSYWRSLQRDAVHDSQLHAIAKQADVVSPWAVGRYAHSNEVQRYASEVWRGDVKWCVENRVDYLPVVFPGFSWHNMNRRSPLGQIPRRGGAFLWEQLVSAKVAGAGMIYVAMFDEMDEGTAIFKCTQTPPVGESEFLDYEGKPSDHYLWLVGQGGRMLRGELAANPAMPSRGSAATR